MRALKELRNHPDIVVLKLKSSDSRAPRLYGLPKIHKTNVPLRPIVSFIESSTYGLSKKLAEILSHSVGKSDRNVKNSYEFVEFLSGLTIESNEIMVSFDVVSLFTKIPVNLALQIVEDRLQASQNLEEITNWTVNDICTGLRICLEATYLHFRGKYFKQIFGTAMGSPVFVVVADLVMEDVEERAIKCFGQPPRICKRYVDDTFVVLDKSNLDPFFAHINGIESSIKFTMEKEEDGSICFLDVSLTRSHTGVISTNVYRKPTHSDRYLNFRSNHPIEHKSAVVNALAHRGNCLISNEGDKELEMKHIYKALNFNGYPARFLNQKLNKAKFEVKQVNQQQSQTEVRGLATLPYIPKLSESIKFVLKSHGIKTVFKPPQKIGNLLSSHKDMVDAEHRQGAVYKIKCALCNQCYIGETKRWFVTTA